MMRAFHPSCVAYLAAALCLAGCSSFESRSSEQAAVYDSLPAFTQQRLERGQVGLGDTPEMVYVAMGKPDEKLGAPDAGGHESAWIYKDYLRQIKDRQQTGWRRVILPEVRGRGDEVTQESVTQDIYRTQPKADLRVAFAGGVVSAVEQLLR